MINAFWVNRGETKTTTKKNGDTYITRIGKNGRATSERHNSTHGNPKEHPNPHEHDVIWQENGAPTLGPGRPVSEKISILISEVL